MIDDDHGTDMDRDDALIEWVEGRIARMHTVGAGTIVEYDHATGRALVQPVVYGWRRDEDTQQIVESPVPPIPNVKIAAWGGDGFSLSAAPRKGDEVLILFAERDHSGWKATAQRGPAPNITRRFDLSDAYGLLTRTQFVEVLEDAARHATDVVLHLDGRNLRIGSATAQTRAARADKVAARIAAIETYLNTLEVEVASAKTVPPETPPFTPCTAADVASDRLYTE